MKSTRTKTTTFRKKGKHITDSERQIIEKLYRKGVPIPQIAALLEVHRSTIYRELQRGRVTHLNSELITFSTSLLIVLSMNVSSEHQRMVLLLKLPMIMLLWLNLMNLYSNINYPSMLPDKCSARKA